MSHRLAFFLLNLPYLGMETWRWMPRWACRRSLNLPYLGMETGTYCGAKTEHNKLNLPYLGMETEKDGPNYGEPPAQSSLFRNGNETGNRKTLPAESLNLPYLGMETSSPGLLFHASTALNLPYLGMETRVFSMIKALRQSSIFLI